MLNRLLDRQRIHKKRKPVGVVEVLNAELISGWCLDHEEGQLSISIQTDGKEHLLPIRRTERADVADAHGTRSTTLGYECRIPSDLGIQLRGALDKGVKPVVRIQSGLLEILPSALTTKNVKGHLDRVELFRLYGWVVCGDARPASIEIKYQDCNYQVRPVWTTRVDVAQAYALEDDKIGFILEVPGYLWALNTSGAGKSRPRQNTSLELQLVADGEVFHLPVRVTKEEVLDWIERACEKPGEHYAMFCALEHARFAELWCDLSTSAIEVLTSFAKRFGLDDAYLDSSSIVQDAKIKKPWATVRHWRALRDFNSALADVATPEEWWEAFVRIKSELTSKEVARSFVDSVVPTICKLDLYERLAELNDVDFGHWCSWGADQDPWRMTIAIPAWLLQKRVENVNDILWRLVDRIDSGWINTECLHYAVRRICEMYEVGKVTADVFNKFVYSYIAVLDAFKGEWHSRLYDLELTRGAITLLRNFENYPDFLRKDLLLGLLRSYGLSRDFWRLVDADDVNPHSPLWLEVKNCWVILEHGINAATARESSRDIVFALRHLESLGVREVRQFARELLACGLAELNSNPNHHAIDLLLYLLEDRSDGLRYAAFPLPKTSQLHEMHPACGIDLRETLRSLSWRPKNDFYSANRELIALANTLAEVSDKNRREWPPEGSLRSLREAAKRGNFLAIELLSWLVGKDVPNKEKLVHETASALVTAIEECQVSGALPAQLDAAYRRLVDEVVGGTVRQDLMALVHGKYPDHADRGYEKGAQVALRTNGQVFGGDTLVVIYSCRKYIDTRIAAIRDTWVKDLESKGIPYVFLVGDGRGELNGDVLELDVSDRYEDLPLKTLALIEWVFRNTSFQYLYKIDDDCYLSVDEFFGSSVYRKHHYYGRVIRRAEGGMDRTWHQSKASTVHAQKTIDKSPEPSTYADGGGGWVLSRIAMRAVCDLKAAPEGQTLISVSLMEDKLLGDILALAHITPSDEEYESYQRRRTFGAAVPVGMWENLFFPSAYCPTVMCHLDTPHDQSLVQSLKDSKELWPKKIWPTSENVLLEWNAHPNQLELLSSADQAFRLRDEGLCVVAVVRNEITMLPHFLDHYRKLGVRCFLFADNCSDDGSREYLLSQPDIVLCSVDTQYKYSHYGVAWQQALLGNFCLNKWAILADADEFLVYPDCENTPLVEFLRNVENEGADGVRVGMVDMYPYGDLGDADFDRTSPFEAAGYFDQRPLTPWRLGSGYYSNATSHVSALRHRIDGQAEPNAFNSLKTAIVRYRPGMRFSKGLHDSSGVNCSQTAVWFCHFKYHSGFKKKVDAEVRRGQHFNGAQEYLRYQAMLLEGKGEFGAEGVSTRYEGAKSLIQGADFLKSNKARA